MRLQGKKKVRAALLSRALERSIIAAGGLNGRVRNGNGCNTPGRGTNQKWAAGAEDELISQKLTCDYCERL